MDVAIALIPDFKALLLKYIYEIASLIPTLITARKAN